MSSKNTYTYSPLAETAALYSDSHEFNFHVEISAILNLFRALTGIVFCYVQPIFPELSAHGRVSSEYSPFTLFHLFPYKGIVR